MTLTIYGIKQSRAMRALWAAEEAGIEYTYEQLDARAGGLRTEAFLALNPGGKVPVIVDDGFVLTESAVIATYIGERAPDKGLVPEGKTRARYRYDQWMAFAVSELEQPLWTIGKHKFALPRDWRVPAVIETAGKEFARAEQVLAAGFGEGPWLLGEQFTMADVMLGHTLLWATGFGMPVPSEALQSYLARCMARPAWKRVLEVDV